jgi:hypothetical protein
VSSNCQQPLRPSTDSARCGSPPRLLLGALLFTLLAAAAFALALVIEVPATASPILGADGEVIARRYYAAINEAIRTGDLSLLDGVAAPGADEQRSDAMAAGCDLRCRVAALYRLAPDAQLVIDEVVADGDRLAVRLHVEANDRPRFLGLPLLDDLSPWASVDFLRIVAGRVAETHSGAGPPLVIEPLARAGIDAIPVAPYRLGLIQLTLAPGASLAELSTAGPLVLLMEHGALAVRADRPVTIRRSAFGSAAARDESGVGSVRIAGGDQLVLATDTGYELSNMGNDPVVVLAAAALEGDGGMTNRWVRARTLDEVLFIPGEPETVSQADAPVLWPPGVQGELLADGVITTGSTAAATIGLARLTFEPSAALPTHHMSGAEMLVVETGSGAVDLIRGQGAIRPRRGDVLARLWPPGDGPLRVLTIAPGGSAVLQPGASAGVRNTGTEPLAMLILTFEPGPAAP